MWRANLCVRSVEIMSSNLGLLVIQDFSSRFDIFDGECGSTAGECLITQIQTTKK